MKLFKLALAFVFALTALSMNISAFSAHNPFVGADTKMVAYIVIAVVAALLIGASILLSIKTKNKK